MSDQLKFSWRPELQRSTMVVCWTDDNSALGTLTGDYLLEKLGGRSFCEIDPVDFFPLGTVAIENDVVQFPESKFYVCPEQDMVIFKSPPPGFEWYRFLNLVMDVARDCCQVRELYTVGGMISLLAHTSPRTITATYSSHEMKQALSPYGLSGDWDFETPPGGRRPRITSFLLWAAKQRGIPAVRFWVPTPFYLTAVHDPGAQKAVLEFFVRRFHWQIDSTDLDEEVRQQNEKLARIRQNFPDIDEAIKKLESNLRLSDEENQKLAGEVTRLLNDEST